MNVTGLPGVSMRFGTSHDGMPIGVQTVGRWQAEFTILHVASLLEQVSPCAIYIQSSKSRPVKSEEMSRTGEDEPFLLVCSLSGAAVLGKWGNTTIPIPPQQHHPRHASSCVRRVTVTTAPIISNRALPWLPKKSSNPLDEPQNPYYCGSSHHRRRRLA